MTKTLYVHCAPLMKDQALGYAAGLQSCAEDDVKYKVVVSVDCPPKKLYVTDKPLV